jgi:membrane-associated phospholipid phosphatase
MDASRQQAAEVLERPSVAVRAPARRPGPAEGIDWRPALVSLFGAYTALALAFSAAGVALVHLGPLEGLRNWDLSVSEWFEAHRTTTWDSVMTFGSRLGETEAVVAVALIAVVVLFRLKHRWAAAMVAFGLALEAATFITANNLVRRERPPVSTVGDAPTTFSFPSGHVAATVVLWGGLALVVMALTRRKALRVLVWLAPLLLVATVASARVYRGMHFLTDVVAGVVLGVLSLAIVWRTFAPPSASAQEDRA